MPKNRGKSGGRKRGAWYIPSARTGAVVAALAAGAGAWWWSGPSPVPPEAPAPAGAAESTAKTPEDLAAPRPDWIKEGDGSGASDGLGPEVMAGQAQLVASLLALLQEVDGLRGEELREQRLAASQRVEAELARIETKIEVGTAAGKQQAGLIALVRSALQSERDGENSSALGADWSDEGLLQAHGLATYASQAYWDEAYSGKRYGESFDWYGSWEQADVEGRSLGDLVRPLLTKDARILVLGCGNSNMSAVMHQEGYSNIVNVDIAEAVIKQMQDRYGHLEGMEWRAMDAGALDFADGAFDAAIEKGLFDALYAGTGARVQAVLSEAVRVLKKPSGRLLSVSFSADRIQRLFMPSEEVREADSSSEELPLSCRIAGELQYKKGGDNTTANATAGSQGFHVYSCDQL